MKKQRLRFIDDELFLNFLQDLRISNPQAAIEVYCQGRISLLFLPQAMSRDKRNWLRRKRNTVLQFGMSTYDFHKKVQGDESLLSSKYGLKAEDFTAVPGAVPLEIESVGIVGCLAITGLSPEEDHELAVHLLNLAIGRQYE
ncbi:MAG: heme-binding protein [Peptoniphilaceae bacterium]|nr:heme-binding protein [Peptoniphilaceae bacterium]MDY5841582.1 heme-binding protein [Peptoniphilaceae bacterium]MDY6146675.1 heme-binding protein [Peptoniphilaceae bacterium]